MLTKTRISVLNCTDRVDYGSYGESSDGEEVMTEKFGEEKKKRSLLRKKIEKRWRLLRSK